MTTPAYLTIGAHLEDPDNASGQVSWPASGNTSLQISGGELILLNRGYQTSYTSDDGLSTITFGSYLNGTTVTGTGSGSSAISGGTCYYDGPWAVIPPNLVNMHDHMFTDIEIAADVDYNTNPDGTFPIYWRSGQNVAYTQTIADQALTPSKFHPSVPESGGHLKNGVPRVYPVSPPNSSWTLIFTAPQPNEWIEYATTDGSGDSDNVPGFPLDSAFLVAAVDSNEYANILAYGTAPIISQASGRCVNVWPQQANCSVASLPGVNTPSRAMLSFCTRFPGSAAFVSFGTGTIASGSWSFRYCYYKNLALTGKYNGTAGTYTQIIETPLSTPTDFSLGSNQSVTLNVPATPTGWDGMRMYASHSTYTNSGGAGYGLQSTNAGFAGGNFTISSVPGGALLASHGFAAWPSGTYLLKDSNATKYYLQKWAHCTAGYSGATNEYIVHDYTAKSVTAQSHSIPAKAIQASHLNTSNAYATGNVLGQDGSGNLAYVSTGGELIRSGPVSITGDGTTTTFVVSLPGGGFPNNLDAITLTPHSTGAGTSYVGGARLTNFDLIFPIAPGNGATITFYCIATGS